MKEFTVCDECKNCIKSWSSGGDDYNSGWNRGCMKHEKPKKRNPESGEMVYDDGGGGFTGYMVFKMYKSGQTFLQKVFDLGDYDMKQFAWCGRINKDGNCEEFERGDGVACWRD